MYVNVYMHVYVEYVHVRMSMCIGVDASIEFI